MFELIQIYLMKLKRKTYLI